MKMIKTIGWTALAALVYYGLEVLFNVIFSLMLKNTTTAQEQMNLLLYANLVMKVIVMLIFGFWYMVRENVWHFRPAYRQVFAGKTLLCLIGIGMLGQYALGFLMNIVKIMLPELFENYTKITDTLSLTNGSPLIMILLVVVAGPIAEELLFRGVIYGKLRDSFTVTQAAVISAAIFGVYHKNIIQGTYAALFGIILAYVFEKTQTIWGSIVMHMMFNLSSYVITGISSLLEKYDLSMPLAGYLLIELACIVCIVLCIRGLAKRENRYDIIQEKKTDGRAEQ